MIKELALVMENAEDDQSSAHGEDPQTNTPKGDDKWQCNICKEYKFQSGFYALNVIAEVLTCKKCYERSQQQPFGIDSASIINHLQQAFTLALPYAELGGLQQKLQACLNFMQVRDLAGGPITTPRNMFDGNAIGESPPRSRQRLTPPSGYPRSSQTAAYLGGFEG